MDFDDPFADDLEALREAEAEQECQWPPAKTRLDFKCADSARGKSDGNDADLSLLNSCESSFEEPPLVIEEKLPETAPCKKRKTPECINENVNGSSPRPGKQPKQIGSITVGDISLLPALAGSFSQLRRRIPAGEYVSVTSESGKRAYLSLRSSDTTSSNSFSRVPTTGLTVNRPSNCLLGMPFEDLCELAAAERNKRQDRSDVSEDCMRTFIHSVDSEIEKQRSTATRKDSHDSASGGKQSGSASLPPSTEGLWVDRYSPRTYIDLLSDETVNRSLLKWLKLWDYVVFKKPKPKLLPKGMAALGDSDAIASAESSGKGIGRGSGSRNLGAGDAAVAGAQHSGRGTKYAGIFKKAGSAAGASGWNDASQAADESELLDRAYRPLQKVALLCGRPGLGKTTLAHIAAKHAGYRVVEMNASDDRSAAAFKDCLESATKMQAIFGEDPKPNCLIIDEIDGAPQAAINVLLSYINIKGTNTGSADGGERKKSKKPPATTLDRPVICICNDLYVPALRQLRTCANIIHFPPSTSGGYLASRLLEICDRERVPADLNALLALCEKAGSDIRSCINTLQFVRSSGQELTVRSIRSMNIGQKDEEKSLFTLWQDIFQLPSSSWKGSLRWSNAYFDLREHARGGDSAEIRERHRQIQRAAQGCSDGEKLVNGLFDNYLHMKFRDDHFVGIATGCEWLCFHDELTQEVRHRQYYHLNGYLSYVPVVFHLIFASPSVPKISYPHRPSEFRQKQQDKVHLLESLTSDIAPTISRFISRDVMVMDVLPSLLGIMQPPLRPINVQLYSAREREQLSDLVDVMITYNLTYLQQRSAADGQYNYVLEPNVEDIVRFPLSEARLQCMPLTYAAKQLIAREVELEKMRRSEQQLKEAQLKQESLADGTHAAAVAVSPTSLLQPAAAASELSTTAAAAAAPGSSSNSGAGCNMSPSVPNHKQRLQPVSVRSKPDEVSRDFFGRIIIKQQPSVDSESSSAGSVASRQRLLGGDIWFKFKEGFSNAVRKCVRVKDLL